MRGAALQLRVAGRRPWLRADRRAAASSLVALAGRAIAVDVLSITGNDLRLQDEEFKAKHVGELELASVLHAARSDDSELAPTRRATLRCDQKPSIRA